VVSLFFSGFAAVFTVALFLAGMIVFCAGMGAGDHRSRNEHLLAAGIIGLLFAAALSQRGVGPADGLTRWIVVGLMLFAIDLGGRRQGHLHPSTVVWALILGSAAVLLRADFYGPALGVLRGSWQSSPDRWRLFVYHLGGGVGLALLYLLGVVVATRLPRILPRSIALAMATAVVLVEATGWIREVQAFLFLHWPGPRWG